MSKPPSQRPHLGERHHVTLQHDPSLGQHVDSHQSCHAGRGLVCSVGRLWTYSMEELLRFPRTFR